MLVQRIAMNMVFNHPKLLQVRTPLLRLVWRYEAALNRMHRYLRGTRKCSNVAKRGCVDIDDAV